MGRSGPLTPLIRPNSKVSPDRSGGASATMLVVRSCGPWLPLPNLRLVISFNGRAWPPIPCPSMDSSIGVCLHIPTQVGGTSQVRALRAVVVWGRLHLLGIRYSVQYILIRLMKHVTMFLFLYSRLRGTYGVWMFVYYRVLSTPSSMCLFANSQLF